jgi:hypothetical protein
MAEARCIGVRKNLTFRPQNSIILLRRVVRLTVKSDHGGDDSPIRQELLSAMNSSAFPDFADLS